MKKKLCVFLLLVLGASLFSMTGDVNKNGTVDIVDALLIAQYTVGHSLSVFDLAAADVNSDGAVNIVDALLIAQYYVGMRSSLFGEALATPVPPKATSKPTAKGGPVPAATPWPTARATMVPGGYYDAPAPVTDSAAKGGASGGLWKPRPVKPPTNATLKAGYADDNEEFNSYLGFLDKYSQKVKYYEMKIYERIILHLKDQNGKSLPNAKLKVSDEKEKLLCQGTSYADGSFMFFPAEYGDISKFNVSIDFEGQSKKLTLDRKGERHIDVVFDLNRPVYEFVPLDMLFIMDTTGSMGEEIRQLKTTIRRINDMISALPSKPVVRYGMVLYRDRGDGQRTYLTQQIPLTSDLQSFQADLNKVGASGGGDKQENLEQALEEAMTDIKWNPEGIRLAWVITDAGPKLYADETYSYVKAAKEAHKNGIKFYSIGAGGLELGGEYVLRQISQYTSAKYIFLTYGEKGESDGGVPGSVSHHTGDQFETDKLESIVLHFTEEELSHLNDKVQKEKETYFVAVKIEKETKEETLIKLFDQATKQLTDYSSISLKKETLVTSLPILTKEGVATSEGEYFSKLLVKSLDKNTVLSVTKDKDIQIILSDLSLDIPSLVDDSKAVLVGAKAGAKVLISTSLKSSDSGFVLTMKLLRVETPEVLGKVTAKISLELGPTP